MDASSYGPGVRLYPEVGGERKPIIFTLCTLMSAGRNYTQREKEFFTTFWACKKFYQYIIGFNKIQLFTNYKPSKRLLNTQDLNNTPLRCQRLGRYNVIAERVPGKLLIVPDTFSCSPLNKMDSSTNIGLYINSIIKTRTLSDRKLWELRNITFVLQKVTHLMLNV